MKSSWRALAPVVLVLLGLCACSASTVSSPGATSVQPPKPERGGGCLTLDTPCSFNGDCCTESCMNAVCVTREP